MFHLWLYTDVNTVLDYIISKRKIKLSTWHFVHIFKIKCSLPCTGKYNTYIRVHRYLFFLILYIQGGRGLKEKFQHKFLESYATNVFSKFVRTHIEKKLNTGHKYKRILITLTNHHNISARSWFNIQISIPCCSSIRGISPEV